MTDRDLDQAREYLKSQHVDDRTNLYDFLTEALVSVLERRSNAQGRLIFIPLKLGI